MIESLEELNKELNKKKSKLYFYGKQHKVIEKIKKNVDIDSVYVNKDYTPYSKKRDLLIKKYAIKIIFHLMNLKIYY